MLCCYGDVCEHIDNMTLPPFKNEWQKKKPFSVFNVLEHK